MSLARLLERLREWLLPRERRYWERRARRFGRRSVLHIHHKDEEYQQITEWQKSVLFPLLRAQLNGSEKTALDFGCGPGRFTAQLAQIIHGRAIGVDPIASLLDLAPMAPNVEYRLLRGHRIPVEDSSIDVAWTCLVLGMITHPRRLQRAVAELDRVLAPNGLVFLVENTTPKAAAKHIVYRSVDEYRALFDFVDLQHLSDYEDVGETLSVLAGRRRG